MTRAQTRGAAIALIVALLAPPPAWAACVGDISVFMERRPVGSTGPFTVIEESGVDTASGIITVCGRDRSWDSGYMPVGEGFQIVVGRRARVFTPVGGGEFLSASYTAEFRGVASEYRFRARR
jgi:hypothetical protein